MKSVFISSTFKDMQAERDYLHERLFPKLRKLVGQYGEDIQELDLRWGVDTYKMSEAESGYQVLRVCIDAIDRCKPYIIVLLGERYGWIPDSGVVESLRDERVSCQYEENMSITNLEIKYGALSEEETLERCIFCFRNSDFINDVPEDKRPIYLAESKEHEAKLSFLKEQIRAKDNAKIVDYQVQWDEKHESLVGMERLGEAIYEMLEMLFRAELAGKEAKNPVQQCVLEAEYTKERYLSTYTSRPYEEKEVMQGLSAMALNKKNQHHVEKYRKKPKEHSIHLLGEAGCGKSALMACLEQRAKTAGAQTILYFSGNSGCQDVHTLKSVIIYRLEEILNIEHDFEPADQNVYLTKLDEQAQRLPIFCFIDALDQLFDSAENVYLDILDLCPNLFVITSSLDNFPYEQSLLKAREIKVIQVQKFSLQDKKILIQKTSAYRGKKIDNVVESLICAKDGSSNPLFLSLLLQRLFSMRQEEFKQAEAIAAGMDGLHLYMKQIIEETPEQVTELAATLFARISEMFESKFFKKVAYLIALSNTGLSEREVAEILAQQNIAFSQLKFQEILYYLYDVFTEKEDGKWVYAHRIFYEAMKQDMGEEFGEIRRYLIEYGESNPEFMEREGYYHVLTSSHPLGKMILENCSKWQNRAQVERLVFGLLKEEKLDTQYFLDMAEGTNAEAMYEFWQTIYRYYQDIKVNRIIDQIYLKNIKNENVPAKWKIKMYQEILSYGDLTNVEEHLQNARRLLPFLEEPKERRLSEIRLDYHEAILLINAKKIEEGMKLLKVTVEQSKELMKDSGFEKEILYWHIRLCFIYTNRAEKLQKEYFVEYLEAALKLYEKYPEKLDDQEAQILKIDIHMACTRLHDKLGSGLGSQYAGKALELARELAEKETGTETLRVLAAALNNYGHAVGRENRYMYRYEALDVYKRIYQLVHTDYWQQEVAVQAIFFAKDVTKLVKAFELSDNDVWMIRAEEAWNLGFAYFEELIDKKYADVARVYYEESLMEYVELLRFKRFNKQALIYAKKVYDALKEDRENGWNPKNPADIYDCSSVSAVMAELLDEDMNAKEAVPYAMEQMKWVRMLYQPPISHPDNGIKITMLGNVSRILYHDGQYEQAIQYGTEGLELLGIYEKERNTIYPTIQFRLGYTVARSLLKQNKVQEAEKYVRNLNLIQEKYLDLWEIGKRKLLYGDFLAAQGAYSLARFEFDKAICYWMDKEKEIHKDVYNLIHRRWFLLKKGDVKRNPIEKKWHIKAFYYYLYSVYRKAEVMEAGNLEDPRGAVSHRGRLMKLGSVPITGLSEYKYAFTVCLEKLTEKSKKEYDPEYDKIAEEFLKKSMHKILELTSQSLDADVENYVYLFQYAAFCKGREIEACEEFKIFAEALSKRNLSYLTVPLAMLKEQEHYWLDIYRYVKDRMEKGMEILPENKMMIAWTWVRFGCYKEAIKWLEQVPGKPAERNKWLCQAMCAEYDGHHEKAIEFIRKMDESYENDPGYSRGTLVENLENELLGNVEKVIDRVELKITRQEQAQRYINVLKIVVESGKYFTFEGIRKEKFWDMMNTANFYYRHCNKTLKHLRKVDDSWEEQAAAMKEMTDGGMIWQIDYKDVERIVFTLFERLYCACQTEEVRLDVARRICDYWRKTRWDVDLYELSLENLFFIREIEDVCGYAPLPPVMEALSVRMNDEDILHNFFHSIPELLKIEEWEKGLNMRQHEVMSIFESLLEIDSEKWEGDFKAWITQEDTLWIAEKMNFFQQPEAIGNDPEKKVFYDVYRQYMLKFREKYTEEFAENLQACTL